jgi:hypothetical protein
VDRVSASADHVHKRSRGRSTYQIQIRLDAIHFEAW